MKEDSDAVGQLRQVLQKHIPELATGAVEIKGIARKPGRRSLVVVHAQDPAMDAVGAVVGICGTRIKVVVAELNREMVDVVRWAEPLDDLLRNLIAPNVALQIRYEEPARRVRLFLSADRGDAPNLDRTRLSLASEITGWELVIE